MRGGISSTGSDTQVNTTTAGDQVHSSITALEGGGYVITWQEGTIGVPGGTLDVFAQVYNAAGAKVGGQIHVGQSDGLKKYNPAIAGLDDGTFVIVWAYGSVGDPGAAIWGKHYSASGGLLQSFQASDHVVTPNLLVDWPAVAAVEGGGFVVTWNREGSGEDHIFARQFTNTGSASGPQIQVTTVASEANESSAVSTFADGSFVVVWSGHEGGDGSGGGTTNGVFARLFAADGSPQGSPFQVNTFAAGDNDKAYVAVLEGGDFVVVWESSSHDGSGDGVYGRRFEADGSPIGGEFQIASNTAGHQRDPSITATDGGGFVVMYASYNDGSESGVFARSFDPTGAPVGPEIQVNQITTGQQMPTWYTGQTIVQLTGGDLVGTWHGNGPTDAWGIVAHRIAMDLNDPPVANDDVVSTAEDTATNFVVRGNDSDGDGDTLTVTAITGPSHGTATINGNGTIRYTPTANYNGPDSFTYTVSDGYGGTDTATVNVTVTAVNDAPVANDDTATVNEDAFVDISARPNDTDIDNAVLTVSSVGTPGHGTASINPSGTIRYAPNANFNGTDSFTYTISDGAGGTDTATVTVTVNPVNDAPVAENDTATTDEDTPFAIDVRANDYDIDGTDALTVTSVGGAAHGTVAINPDGTVQYTPHLNYNGADSFTYTLSDGKGGTDTATVAITVNPVNDTPVANPNTRLMDENTAADINVRSNDTDVDLDILTVSDVGAAANGVTSINPDGTVRYTPNADWWGVDSFDYTISDGAGGFATSTVTVTVNNVPEAGAEYAYTTEEAPVTINVLANDVDADGDVLFVSAVTNGAHGTVANAGGGNVTYTPGLNFFGEDSFTYTVSDGRGGTETQTVRVNVGEVVDDGERLVNSDRTSGYQDEPTIAALEGGGYVVLYHDWSAGEMRARIYGDDGAPIGNPFLVNTYNTGSQANGVVAALADGGFIAVYSSQGFDGGTTSVAVQRFDALGNKVGAEFVAGPAGVGGKGSPTVTGLEDGGFVIAYTLGQNIYHQRYDADGQPVGGQVKMNLNYSYGEPSIAALEDGGWVVIEYDYYGHNFYRFNAAGVQVQGPVIVESAIGGSHRRSAVAGLEDGGFIVVWEASAMAGDVSGNALAGRRFDASGVATGPDFLIPTHTAGHQAWSSVAALPNGGFIVQWTSEDPGGSGKDVYAQVFDAAGVKVGAPFIVNETLPYSQTGQGYNGSTIAHNPQVAVLNDGTVAFVWNGPGEGENSPSMGVFTRRFDVLDALDGPPVAAADIFQVNEGETLTVGGPGVLFNDVEPIGDDLTAILVEGPEHGDLVFNGDGSFEYTPDDDFDGVDTFTYRAEDSSGAQSEVVTVSINVGASNDQPDAKDDEGFTTEPGEALAIDADDLLHNDVDVDGDTLAVVSVQNAEHGTVTLDGGVVTFIPEPGFTGEASFTYTVSDGNGGSDSATATVMVEASEDPNTAPDAVADGGFTAEHETALTITPSALLGNDTDADGDILSILSVQGAVNGSVTINGLGQVVFTPADGYAGPASFTYTVSDGHGGQDTATVNLTVEAPAGSDNAAPTASNDSYGVDEDGVLSVPASGVLANDNDPDGDAISAIIVTGPSNGDLVLNADGSFTYTPDADFHGVDSFTYRAGDGSLTSGEATVEITVDAVNDNPAGAFTTDLPDGTEDQPYVIDKTALLANYDDVDGDTLSIENFAVSAGSATDDGDSFTITPPASFNGEITFTFDVVDGQGGSAPGSGAVQIAPVNDAPEAADNGGYSTAYQSALSTPVAELLANDSDIDGGALSIVSVQDAVNGAVEIVGGNVVFTPSSGYSGPASYSYTVSDGVGGFDSATVSLTVGAAPPPEDETFVSTSADESFDGGAGIDTVDYYPAINSGFGVNVAVNGKGPQDTGGGGFDTLRDIENLRGSQYEDRLQGDGGVNRLLGETGDDRLIGGGGGDILDGGEGDDTIVGGLGDDTLTGGEGDDKLNGSDGADLMYGGAGDDTYTVDNIGDVISETTSGGLDAGGADAVRSSIDFELGAFLENLTLTGVDDLGGLGNALANKLTGNDGANHLQGFDGKDVLRGGDGDDLLEGGAATDTLTGGLGADTFMLYAPGTGADKVTDFQRAEGDRIALTAADFGLVAGPLDPAMFSNTGAATSASGTGQFVYNAAKATLSYDADGAGGAGAVAIAIFATNIALTAADIDLM